MCPNPFWFIYFSNRLAFVSPSIVTKPNLSPLLSSFDGITTSPTLPHHQKNFSIAIASYFPRKFGKKFFWHFPWFVLSFKISDPLLVFLRRFIVSLFPSHSCSHTVSFTYSLSLTRFVSHSLYFLSHLSIIISNKTYTTIYYNVFYCFIS